MNNHVFYIQDDKQVNLAFEFLKSARQKDSIENIDNFYFYADVFSIEKEGVQQNQDIINVLIQYGLIQDFGLPIFPKDGDFSHEFMLTSLGELFKENETKFKEWIVHAEKKRRIQDERNRKEQLEPIELAVKGAVRAAIIGAILASIFGFAFGLLTSIISGNMNVVEHPAHPNQSASEPVMSEELNSGIKDVQVLPSR